MSQRVSDESSVIPKVSDRAANDANLAAIDRLVRTQKYHHIIAWGKFLGFTPVTITQTISDAEVDNAPADAIQKIDGRWNTLADIENETNRQRVEALAAQGLRTGS
jgi:hypothetical protein